MSEFISGLFVVAAKHKVLLPQEVHRHPRNCRQDERDNLCLEQAVKQPVDRDVGEEVQNKYNIEPHDHAGI